MNPLSAPLVKVAPETDTTVSTAWLTGVMVAALLVVLPAVMVSASGDAELLVTDRFTVIREGRPLGEPCLYGPVLVAFKVDREVEPVALTVGSDVAAGVLQEVDFCEVAHAGEEVIGEVPQFVDLQAQGSEVSVAYWALVYRHLKRLLGSRLTRDAPEDQSLAHRRR